MNSLIVICILAASTNTAAAFNIHQPTRVATTTSTSTSTSSTALYAKKKKGKTPKQQKKGGFEWASSFILQPFEAKAVREMASTAVASFKGRAGKHLMPELETSTDIPKTLWYAPNVACVIVRPGMGEDGDGVSTSVEYANIAALETVGLKPADFQQLFSTGAPPALPKDDDDDNDNEEEEADQVAPEPPADLTIPIKLKLNLPPVMKGDTKFERDYSKKILKRNDGDASSNDITILNAYRWDLEKSTLVGGKFVTTSIAVAYAWTEWMVGDALLCRPGGLQEVVGDLEDKISQQAAVIRGLKEEQGLGNKDPQVVAAVAELLRLKAKDVKEVAK